MAMCGDGATSEGDFHEAMNFAAVFNAPVVFFVQNNEYAISVPLARQSVAPSLAHKGVGYGVPRRARGRQRRRRAAGGARRRGRPGPRRRGAAAGRGAHLPDAGAHQRRRRHPLPRRTRRSQAWVERDPITRLEAYLRGRGLLDDDAVAAYAEEAERLAAHTREGLNRDVEPTPRTCSAHVYAEPTPQLPSRPRIVARRAEPRGRSHEGEAR